MKKKKLNAREKRSLRSANKGKKSFNKKRLIIIVAVLLLFGVLISRIARLQYQHYQLVKENKELKEQRRELKIELKNVSSREYIEEQARKQLRMVDPDEILFVFPDKGDSDDSESEE